MNTFAVSFCISPEIIFPFARYTPLINLCAVSFNANYSVLETKRAALQRRLCSPILLKYRNTIFFAISQLRLYTCARALFSLCTLCRCPLIHLLIYFALECAFFFSHPCKISERYQCTSMHCSPYLTPFARADANESFAFPFIFASEPAMLFSISIFLSL